MREVKVTLFKHRFWMRESVKAILLRVNVPPYAEHKLDNLSLTDDDLIQAMLADPLLINRPIVVSDKGVKLCRPSEVVLDLIDTPLTKTFIKEDGEKIEPTL